MTACNRAGRDIFSGDSAVIVRWASVNSSSRPGTFIVI